MDVTCSKILDQLLKDSMLSLSYAVLRTFFWNTVYILPPEWKTKSAIRTKMLREKTVRCNLNFRGVVHLEHYFVRLQTGPCANLTVGFRYCQRISSPLIRPPNSYRKKGLTSGKLLDTGHISRLSRLRSGSTQANVALNFIAAMRAVLIPGEQHNFPLHHTFSAQILISTPKFNKWTYNYCWIPQIYVMYPEFWQHLYKNDLLHFLSSVGGCSKSRCEDSWNMFLSYGYTPSATNYTKLSPFWKANSPSVSEEIFRRLWNLIITLFDAYSMPDESSPYPYILLQIHFNIIIPFMPTSST
jgi:hypothetical protein